MLSEIGLLLLRTVVPAMLLFGHGLPKLLNFSASAAAFPDPLHITSTGSLLLTIFGEVLCALNVMLGIATRLSCIPVILMFLVIIVGVHGGDPWPKKEFAILYTIPFIAVMALGPGRFSFDWIMKGRR